MGWENGAPVVRDVPKITPVQIQELGAAVIAQPYSEPGDELAVELGLPPSRFYGRPLIEVMLTRQAQNAAITGDTQEVEAILDRRLGKPKQSVESHSISETYEQYITRVAEAESKKAAIPATVVPQEVDIFS